MVIPWILGVAVLVLVGRWWSLWLIRREEDRAFEYRIRRRQDLWKL